MFIKNFKQLARSKGRRDALKILNSGLEAVRTDLAVRNAIKLKGKKMTVGDRVYDLSKFKNIHVIGFGKASYMAAKEIEKILGANISDGIVLDVIGGKLKRIKSIIGTHPFPSMRNVRAAGEIMRLLEKAGPSDLVIAIVSGGGSALLCRPQGVKCGELALITKMMMRRGAGIREMNTVRKHLSEILGGQFVRLAHPAAVLGLIFSDVPGDDLEMVASGPTVMDTTTVRDAARILVKYDIVRSCALPSCELTETPKDKALFRRVHNVLIVANAVAVGAMKKAAERLGYRTRIISTSLEGEARTVGKQLAAMPDFGEAVVAGGETTITLTGTGAGGRSQELALGAVKDIVDGTVVVGCASDGRDNSPAAGAIADMLAKEAARRLKIDIDAYLADNASFAFAKRTRSQIMTGSTGINISDLMIALRPKK
jgi:glycerate-2-kinase